MGLSRRTWAAIVVVVAVTAGGSTAVANHLFDDVGTGTAYHDEVANIVQAGCATGFPDDTFRPTEAPNRQQFAAWMYRCGGRVTWDTGVNELEFTGADITIAGVDLIAGGVDAPTSLEGYVLVTASVEAWTTDVTDCPCSVGIRLRLPPEATGYQNATLLGNDDELAPAASHTVMSATTVFVVEPGAEVNIRLDGRFIDADVDAIQMEAELTALYVPFAAPTP